MSVPVYVFLSCCLSVPLSLSRQQLNRFTVFSALYAANSTLFAEFMQKNVNIFDIGLWQHIDDITVVIVKASALERVDRL